MNDKLINELKNAYHVEPNNKDQFIRSIKKNDLSTFKFILLQSKYLHSNAILKNILLVVGMVLICLNTNNNDSLLFVSAGIPLIVLVMMYELETSKIYKMQEIEKVTRFSLKMLVLSRLLITGIVSLLSVIVITLFAYKTKGLPLLNLTVTFFLPYLMTVYACMKILRKYQDTGIKYCFIVSALISLIFIVIANKPVILNVLYKTNVSTSLLLIVSVLVLIESKNYIVNVEECLWN